MELLFTGTGSGAVSLKRYHSSFLLKSRGSCLLVDSGEGISRALLAASAGFNSITHIVLTHFHPDHLNGLPSLLIQMKMQKREESLGVFVHKELRENLERLLRMNYIFAERMNFPLRIFPFDSKSMVDAGNITFMAIENSHLEKYGERENNLIKESPLISLSFLFSSEGKSIWYTGDIGKAEDLSLYKGAPDIYISESTHIGTEGLKQLVSDRRIKTIFITHIADDMEEELSLWHSSLTAEDQARCRLAGDGMRVIF